MNMGEVVQIGTPVELFEKPQHTFVGHFIGSPGMNILPCELSNGKALVGGMTIDTANSVAANSTGSGKTEIGIRPEFVRFADEGLEASVINVADAGRFNIVETNCAGNMIKLLSKKSQSIPSENVNLAFNPEQTRIYVDGLANW